MKIKKLNNVFGLLNKVNNDLNGLRQQIWWLSSLRKEIETYFIVG